MPKVYDKHGNLLSGAYIKDGKTYKADGTRIGVGTVVHADNGKYYRMDDDDDPTNNEITKDLFDQLGQMQASTVVTTGSGGYSKKPVAVTYPTAPTGGKLSNDYGITQDRAELEKLLLGIVDTKYDQLNVDQKRAENTYYDAMAATQDTVLDTLRTNKINAIQTGATKGMQAANELSAVLGLSQVGSDGATQMAQAESDLYRAKAADTALAKSQALTDSNALGQALAEIGSMFYNSDVVRYGSELNHNAAMDANIAAYMAQKYASDSGLAGALAQANATRDATKMSADAQKYAATLGNDATRLSGWYNLQAAKAANDNPFFDVFKNMTPEEQKAFFEASVLGNADGYYPPNVDTAGDATDPTGGMFGPFLPESDPILKNGKLDGWDIFGAHPAGGLMHLINFLQEGSGKGKQSGNWGWVDPIEDPTIKYK